MNCTQCGNEIYRPELVLMPGDVPLCTACLYKSIPPCGCSDCQRKADPEAFDRRERARRALEEATSKSCVECGCLMSKGAHRYSLACPACVAKLGTDEATGRWDGVPADAQKGAV